MNGKLLLRGRVETYPFRIPMPLSSRLALIKTGIKVGGQVLRYARVTRQRPGEDPSHRQQRIYGFENDRTFRDFTGALPEDADALFRPTVIRSAADPHEISAGAGIGYFSLVWNIGHGLNRGILGGPSTLTEGIAAALGDRVQLGAEVIEIVHKQRSVLVRYRQAGADHEAEGRFVVLATPATVSHRVAVDIPQDIREALGKVRYGPYVSAAFLTNETTPQPWDDAYAIATPKRSFNIVLNQSSLIRGSEPSRQPGSSIMTFSPPAWRARCWQRATTRSSASTPATWTMSSAPASAAPSSKRRSSASRPVPPTASRAGVRSSPRSCGGEAGSSWPVTTSARCTPRPLSRPGSRPRRRP